MISHAEGRGRLRAGHIGRAHGLDGSFHVTHPNHVLLSPGQQLLLRQSQAVVVERKGTDQRPIVRLDQLADRDAAELARGEPLLVPRENAPELGEDEWWAEDLEGCTVRSGTREVGTVTRLIALPSCEAIEIERGDGGPLLVPLVSDAVLAVDVGRREIRIDLVFLGE